MDFFKAQFSSLNLLARYDDWLRVVKSLFSHTFNSRNYSLRARCLQVFAFQMGCFFLKFLFLPNTFDWLIIIFYKFTCKITKKETVTFNSWHSKLSPASLRLHWAFFLFAFSVVTWHTWFYLPKLLVKNICKELTPVK